MPKRKEPELTPGEQFKRFVKTAREHGVDENGDELEKAFRRISESATPTTPSPRNYKKDEPSQR